MYNHFSGDPHWITAKFNSVCESCKGKISKGARAFYYPKGKHIFCDKCGQGEYESFRAAAEDEYMMTGYLPGY